MDLKVKIKSGVNHVIKDMLWHTTKAKKHSHANNVPNSVHNVNQ